MATKKEMLDVLWVERTAIGSSFISLNTKDKETKRYKDIRKKLVDIKKKISDLENNI